MRVGKTLNNSPIPGTTAGLPPADDLIWRTFQASTEFAIICLSRDGDVQQWNEGACRLFGHATEDVVGKTNWRSLCAPSVGETLAPSDVFQFVDQEGSWEGKLAQLRHDGSPFEARVVVTRRGGELGRDGGWMLIVKEIADESAGHHQGRNSGPDGPDLEEPNIDPVVITDLLGTITNANQKMVDLVGHTRETLIGMAFNDLCVDVQRAQAFVKVVLQDHHVSNFELVFLARKQTQTFLSFNASIVRDAQGKSQGIVAAARDITGQKELEQCLRRSEAYNRGLIQASAAGLLTVDPLGMVTDINETMCRKMGYSPDEILGTPFSAYFVDAERAMEGVRETLQNGVVTDFVLTLACRDGKEKKVSFNASVFRDPEGEVKGIFASFCDITEQLMLQSKLVAERAYNRGLIEASLDGLITVNPLLEITDVNETMCRMTGFARAELVGASFDKFFTNPRHAADGLRLTFDKGTVSNHQLTLCRADGSHSLVSFNAAIFRGTGNAVQCIFASARDISDQAKLQQQVSEERAYSRALIEASVDGLVAVDETMKITDVNETMCRMVGRPRNHIVGSVFPTYFAEHELAEEGVRLTFKHSSVANYVLTLLGADGGTMPVSFNAATLKDTNGEVRGIFASARNITVQKALEEQLQASQVYTRSLIESNIDALITTDLLGVISDVNRQMEALTGLTRDDLIGSPFKAYFTDPGRAEEGIKRVLSEGRVTNYELTARAADACETVVSYNAVTFKDKDGILQGVFAAARDVTEQKKLEEQLREQQFYLRGLIESSVDGLIAVDEAGIITDVNDRICKMTGYTRVELLGTPFSDYFTEGARAAAGVQRTLDEGMVTEYALTLVTRTRRHLQVSFNTSVFRDPQGSIRGVFASARDITDRVRLEEQMRDQQTYLRGLIEASVDGLVTVDPLGFITDVNEELCRMTGYQREELIGSGFKNYFTDAQRADLGVKRTFAENVVTNYELVIKPKHGRKATVSFNASVYRSSDGRIEGIFASARDISEQARLQTQVAEQQAYNRSLFEASADALFAIAPDGIVTDVNEEATRLTGYSRKHLINTNFSSYFTMPNVANEGVLKTLLEKRVVGYELVLITRHGRRIAVSFNAGVFSDAQGALLGILAGARDITEQKQLEQQLRDSHFYTRSLIESSIDALMTTDTLGIITDVNQQMEELTGATREVLIGSAFKTYFTDPHRAEEGIKQVLGEGRVTNYELVACGQDGRSTVVSYNAVTFADRNGKLQGVFAAARDVTERKRFEQTLQEKNVELENANFAKDRFLASMSHELRTPLNAIIGFTGTLLMRLPGNLNTAQDGQLRTVQSSAQHLLSLINDLLDLAKIESGNVTLKLEPLNAGEVINDVAKTLAPMADAKGLRFEWDISCELSTVLGDRRAINQILLNLANNAIKFTETGFVALAARTRVVDGESWVDISVTDSGIGIREEDQTLLFEAFRRVGLQGGRRYEGTGLGLHLSQKLARLMGGRIHFQSTFAQGSVFTLSLKTAL